MSVAVALSGWPLRSFTGGLPARSVLEGCHPDLLGCDMKPNAIVGFIEEEVAGVRRCAARRGIASSMIVAGR